MGSTPTCPSGQVACGSGAGTCVNPLASTPYCGPAGACGTACPTGYVCNGAGTCAFDCVSPEIICNGECVDPTSNTQYCGATSPSCTGLPIPTGGICVGSMPACPTGQTACGSAPGICTDTLTSNQYCHAVGACGGACSVAGETCQDGVCAASCGGALISCSDTCVDPRFDPSHCNGCNNVCNLPNTTVDGCDNSACTVITCATGYNNCNGIESDGCESNPLTDVSNCGGCGIACTGTEAPFCITGACTSGMVTNYAGNGSASYADGTAGPSEIAQFDEPYDVAVDSSGNVYVADTYNYCIRKIDTNQNVTTFAGNGTAGFADGTGGPNGTAQFGALRGIAIDTSGNLYVLDWGNGSVRKIVPNGTVTTLAGSGQFTNAQDVAVDTSGNVYVADSQNNRIREIAVNGTVTTLAGNGTYGYVDGTGGAGGTAEFELPYGIAVDTSGNVYVGDANDSRVRKIAPNGSVTTLAGNGTFGYANGTGGPGGTAEFAGPYGLAVDSSGNVYVADNSNHRIREIAPNGTVTLLAGNGARSYANGAAITAGFDQPTGVAVDTSGNVYVADYANSDIRMINTSGTVSTLAGNQGQGFVNGTGGSGGSAAFNNPLGVAIDSLGNVYVADTSNNRIREIAPNGTVTTLAGNGTSGHVDGTGGAAGTAEFDSPQGVAVDASGNVYVADKYNSCVREIAPNGTVITLAGGAYGYADGTGGAGGTAKFYEPYGVAVDLSGNVYVADWFNNRIRKIAPGGTVTTLAGNGAASYVNGTGGANGTAEFNRPQGVAVDTSGNVYVADTNNNCIRAIAPNGTVTTLAGNGTAGSFDGTGGAFGTAEFNGPSSVAVDASGNVYVADELNNTIRIVNASGVVSTIAGSSTGEEGYANGTGGPFGTATFSTPAGVAVDLFGNIYVADSGNNRIRLIAP